VRLFLTVAIILVVASSAMADRTAVTVTTAPGPAMTDGAAITKTSADELNGLEFTITGDSRELLFVNNPTGGSLNVSISSVADDLGRTGDIEDDAIAGGACHVYGRFNIEGWSNGGKVQFSMDDGLKAWVIKLD